MCGVRPLDNQITMVRVTSIGFILGGEIYAM